MSLKFFVSAVLFVALAITASAQTPNTVQVTIPFAFTVHNTDMPAGEYRISRAYDGSCLLTLQNVETRKSVLVLSRQSSRGLTADQSSVGFQASSLADVWFAGSASGARLAARPADTAAGRP